MPNDDERVVRLANELLALTKRDKVGWKKADSFEESAETGSFVWVSPAGSVSVSAFGPLYARQHELTVSSPEGDEIDALRVGSMDAGADVLQELWSAARHQALDVDYVWSKLFTVLTEIELRDDEKT